MLTLSKAAQEVGLSKTALFNAVKSGKVSATKNERGQYLIDPAELFRVYEPVNRVNVNMNAHSEQKLTTDERILTGEIELLKQLLEQVKDERDYLRRQLENEAVERRKLTLMLTHQPEQKVEQVEPKKSLLLEKLFGRK